VIYDEDDELDHPPGWGFWFLALCFIGVSWLVYWLLRGLPG